MIEILYPLAPSSSPTPLPLPRLPLSTCPATLADLPFIDGLQKRHARQVGWMPTRQLAGGGRDGG